MSLYTPRVVCDGKKDHQCLATYVAVVFLDWNEMLRRMERDGWLHKDGKDYCPECAKKMKGEK